MPKTVGEQPMYVPVLKGKEGEFAALEALSSDVKPHILPLIEIPDIPYDYVNDLPAKSLDDHIAGFASRLRKCWRGAPLYLYLPRIGEQERLSDGRVALEGLLSDCAKQKVNAIPVLSRTSSVDSLSAAQHYSAITNSGACVRLNVADFGEDIDLEGDIGKLLGGIGVTELGAVDLIADLGDLGGDTGRSVLVARSILSMIPRKDEWNRIVLASSSFPEDLSDVDAATTTRLPRREWQLWRTIQKRPGLLPRRDLMFADYGIAHPITKELDPRTMRMSASIRYTTPQDWLVVKGRNVRQYGFDQYFELCKVLVDRPEYAGSDFSWGDRYIHDCAVGMTGPGNATTWRKVGTNHHLTLVTSEIARMSRAA
jgi:hypothetical protein